MNKTGDHGPSCRAVLPHRTISVPLYRILSTTTQRTTTTMNQIEKQAFERAANLFKDAHVPENMQAMAQQGVVATQKIYVKTAAAAHDGAKAFTEIADTAWGSTKLLNEMVVQNVTTNFEAAFEAAQKIATAKSLPEIMKLQTEYFQKFVVQASEQTKEFVDLSTRATQHVFEKAQAASTKSFKPTL
jgi:phasin family protein